MLYVDRIEGELAVCQDEDEGYVHIPVSLFDTPVAEGDCVVQSGERYAVDVEATAARRRKMAARLARLRKRDSAQ